MEENSFVILINKNLGKILGGFLGLLIAAIIMIFGFWRALFIFFCIGAGICLGAQFEKNHALREFLEKIWFKHKHY